jgi:LPS-assembly protein
LGDQRCRGAAPAGRRAKLTRFGTQVAALTVLWLASASALAAAGALASGVVNVTADEQEWVQDQLWCGLGDVHLTYQDISIRCDEIEVDQETMHLHAEGNVILDQGDTRMTCSRMEFDLNRKVGTLYDVQAFFPPSYSFRGEELEKLDETHYRFHKGLFTSCKLGEAAPPWSIDVRDAVIQLEGYGHFRDASLRVKGVPIFYTPRLVWPVKRERAAGFLTPSFGFNSTRGAYFGNSFFWPVSRSFDTTFFLDLYSKHTLGIGDEMRWAPGEQARGQIAGALIYDPVTKHWKWKATGKHRQLLGNGWSLNASLDEVSDIDFFRQFEHDITQLSGTLDSYAVLTRSWGPQALNFRTERTRQFSTNPTTLTTTDEYDLERLGEVEYRLRSTRIGETPLYVTAVASADAFRIHRASQQGTYDRFDLFPNVSLLAPGFSWLNITPTVGARETYYTVRTSTNGLTLVDQPLSRQYGTAGLSIVGPSFSRLWALANGDKIKHLIEPRIDYTYVSNAGSSGQGSTSQPQIPLVDDKDTLLVSNQVLWTLANVLFVKKGPSESRDVVRFEISQPYSFSTPLTTDVYPGVPIPVQSHRGPLSLWLNLKPLSTATVDARASIDPVTRNLQSTSLSGSFYQGTNAATLTWYSSYNPVVGGLASSNAALTLSLAPSEARWQIQTTIASDIHQQRLQQQNYVFRWRGSCWGALFEFHDLRNQVYPTRSYRIAIDLTGLGTFLDIHGSMDAAAQ